MDLLRGLQRFVLKLFQQNLSANHVAMLLKRNSLLPSLNLLIAAAVDLKSLR